MHAAMLVLALLAAFAGMGWLAVAMPAHWQQVRRGEALLPRTAAVLRGLGVVALLGSLALCPAADLASMAWLVWVMALSAAAFVVALLLSWRPGWLRPLAGVVSGR